MCRKSSPFGEGKGEGPTGSWYVRLPLLGQPHPQPLSEWRGGVVCEVTPTGLLMIGDKLLDIRRTSGDDASVGCNAL